MNGLLILATATAIHHAPAQSPWVDVTLVPEFLSVQPGSSFRVAVRLHIPDGWHIYWTNPGQSGLPSTLTWSLPSAIQYTTTAWPVPDLEDSAGIVSHTYRGEVPLVSSFRVASVASLGTVDLVASLSWGICREICVPQRRTVRISLPIDTLVPRGSTRWEALNAAAAPRLPVAPEPLAVRAVAKRGRLELTIRRQGAVQADVRGAAFFPQRSGSGAVALRPRAARGVITLEVPDRAWQDSPTARIQGVLVLEPGGPLLLDVAVEKVRE